ncbi:3-phosphoshikimate 1-carboxyvinyltransferase [Velocimicrobium porci]|uniref:3-phosphoshikimate 1-carboxyvinyltransferase n=1 Tax=Velocimicrobium porci TaxID=2606634 RepID=A0A6L5XZC3_9FIRM|nr:3-phosphoshikimate 1-carboxyvinyltransferase [Velocimicrobium porci]MSS63568.1 3-phosphoshikimate 1-carboxyvinyltransferase [Velocimicrobium porci]
MNSITVSSLKGELSVPGDKSISHRAIMLGSLANGLTEITNFLDGEDCLSTIRCFKEMGIKITQTKDTVAITGNGLYNLSAPKSTLNVGNSGTTARLLSGILAGQTFESTITGDESIQSRPMKRIIEPLSSMGADIASIYGNDCAPLHIKGSKLTGISYQSPIASAQVKSSILFAGLYADGTTSVTEPYLSRNHSELMLQAFGANVKTENTTITITPSVNELAGQKIKVPGDISSAAYFIAAALIVPNSEIKLCNIGINPTRDGILQICQKMGADIKIENQHTTNGELVADLIVRSSSLTGTTIEGEIIPTLIDEIPIISVLACVANGTTIIKDAAELKVKESNRIDAMVKNLSKMGADITATEDGMIIHGGKPLHGTLIDSKKDHRVAMSCIIASLIADGPTGLSDFSCINISYPNFLNDLSKLHSQ